MADPYNEFGVLGKNLHGYYQTKAVMGRKKNRFGIGFIPCDGIFNSIH